MMTSRSTVLQTQRAGLNAATVDSSCSTPAPRGDGPSLKQTRTQSKTGDPMIALAYMARLIYKGPRP